MFYVDGGGAVDQISAFVFYFPATSHGTQESGSPKSRFCHALSGLPEGPAALLRATQVRKHSHHGSVEGLEGGLWEARGRDDELVDQTDGLPLVALQQKAALSIFGSTKVSLHGKGVTPCPTFFLEPPCFVAIGSTETTSQLHLFKEKSSDQGPVFPFLPLFVTFL